MEEKKITNFTMKLDEEEIIMLNDIAKERGLKTKTNVVRQLIKEKHDELLTKI